MEEMFIAHLSTANFDFYFVADSHLSMLEQAENTWNLHKARTKALWNWETVKEDLYVMAMPVNSGHKR